MNIHLMSSNIRFDNPSDTPNLWNVRKNILASLYKKFNLDILGTQEGRQGQILELASLLNDFHLIDTHREWITERMYPSLFIKKGRFDILDSGDIWLSETPEVKGSKSFDSTFPRLCTWAALKDKTLGIEFLIANAHLDHILKSTRLSQSRVLVNEIRNLTKLPIILLGDFNESPKTEVQQLIKEELNLSDPWVHFNKKEETSHHGFLGEECLDGDRIDWILIPKEFDCTAIDLIKEQGPNEIYPSDHYPLFATLIPKCR